MLTKWRSAPSTLALTALLAVCIVVATRYLYGERSDASLPATVPSLAQQVPVLPPVAIPKASDLYASRPTAPATPGPAFDQRNLFADFQAALGSSDRSTLEAGLAAWRACAGYVGLGGSDIESWVNFVMPEGLSRDEWDRRAQYARASAARCAGFAMQSDALGQAELLAQRAIETGSAAERLRAALYKSVDPQTPSGAVPEISCAVVEQYPESSAGIRYVTPAIRRAASSRSTHMLNQAPQPARAIAINLALCDLDPQGCGVHSNFVGSACVQAGKCTYGNEIEYWQGETSPENYKAAQGLRQAIVSAVKRRDCVALFQ